MRRICLILCLCAAVAGCAASGDKGSWDAAKKDWNGDNMKMSGGWSNSSSAWDRPLQVGSR